MANEMSKKIVIQDTADVIFTDITTGKVVLNAETQLAGISGTVSEEDLYGSIGNKKLFKIRSQKDLNLTVRSAFASMDYWSMTQGVSVDEDGTAFVTAIEELPITENNTDLEVTITGLDASVTEVIIVDENGEQHDVAVTGTKVVIPTPTTLSEGDKVQVIYQKKVQGNSISIDAEKFSNKWKCEMRTIAYDPDTAKVYSDIYFIFPEVLPSGEFEINLENGSVYTPEISFSVLAPKDKSELGQIIEVPRA